MGRLRGRQPGSVRSLRLWPAQPHTGSTSWSPQLTPPRAHDGPNTGHPSPGPPNPREQSAEPVPTPRDLQGAAGGALLRGAPFSPGSSVNASERRVFLPRHPGELEGAPGGWKVGQGSWLLMKPGRKWAYSKFFWMFSKSLGMKGPVLGSEETQRLGFSPQPLEAGPRKGVTGAGGRARRHPGWRGRGLM